MHNEQESWDCVTELWEDSGEGFLGIAVQSGICSQGCCGKDKLRGKVYPRFSCLLPHWTPCHVEPGWVATVRGQGGRLVAAVSEGKM